MNTEVAAALLDIGGAGFRPSDPVTFKSGIKSPVYCDNRMFPFWPQQWRKVITGFQELIATDGVDVDVIGGVEAAGIPHSAALGYAMAKPSLFIRKEAKAYGGKKRIEGGDVAGRCVVLVEDLITTGSSSLSAIAALRAEGAKVNDCLCIISYGFTEAIEQFAAAGVRLHAVTTFADVLRIALDRGMLDAAGAASVADWLREPHGWGARQGLEASR